MKRLLLLFILIPSLCLAAGTAWAAAPDRRISDNDGDVVSVSSTGALTVTLVSGSDIVLENSESISNSTNGIICLEGSGQTNNEDICFGLEANANVVEVTSTTSVNTLRMNLGNGILFLDEKDLIFGTSSDLSINWETTDNDSWQIGIRTPGDATSSGYISIMEAADLGVANRSPSGTSADPVLRVYSSDAGQAGDFIEMFHDQANAFIKTGAGGLRIEPTTSLTFSPGNGFYSFQDNEIDVYSMEADAGKDQVTFGPRDGGGNQIVITNGSFVQSDFDHATQTDPTLFIHSDTNPNNNNTQFGQLFHDKFDFVLQGGSSGDIIMQDATGVTAQFTRQGIIPILLTGDPCTAAREGAIFYNNTKNVLCFCDGSNDLEINDNTACF